MALSLSLSLALTLALSLSLFDSGALQDVVFCTTNQIGVFFGLPTYPFFETAIQVGPVPCNMVAVGLFDAGTTKDLACLDGGPNIFVVRQTSNRVYVQVSRPSVPLFSNIHSSYRRLSTRFASFTIFSSVPTLTNARAVLAAPVVGSDALEDLVVGSSGGVHILRCDTSSMFAVAQFLTIPVGTTSGGIAFADLNEDGNARDVLHCNMNLRRSIYTSATQSYSSLTPITMFPVFPLDCSDVKVANLDGVLSADLVVLSYSSLVVCLSTLFGNTSYTCMPIPAVSVTISPYFDMNSFGIGDFRSYYYGCFYSLAAFLFSSAPLTRTSLFNACRE